MKRLIICADGTWGSPETKHPSNVVRLTRAIATYGLSNGTSNGQAKDEQIEHIVYYDWGIGTDADKHLAAIPAPASTRIYKTATGFSFTTLL